ncbi:uncharacterized protein L203_100034 [Cryptococcus depauperatus CBS 7841]|uniref:Protein ZIP4 homolog n=1 Tax=Cryptococcus depauperatus CBS 7841 TaxID=1295531 RepID=A0AAJ8LX06_9TREE
MVKDAYITVQESIEQTRVYCEQLFSGTFTAIQTRSLLKSLDNVQQAVYTYSKSKRGRKKKEDDERLEAKPMKTDWFDREGVQLWNLASEIGRTTPCNPSLSKEELATIAALRLTGFRLVEITTDLKGPINFIVRLLGLVAKTITALLDAGKISTASQLSLQGAEYEQMIIDKLPLKGSEEFEQRLSVLIWFYIARIDILLQEGNDAFALDLLFKALQLEDAWMMNIEECQLLAFKCWTVGNDMLNKGVNLPSATDWLKQGAILVEKMVIQGDRVENLEALHVAVLKSLARAQILLVEKEHNSFTSATATLNELAKLVGENDRETFHEIRLLQLYILKTEKAPEKDVQTVTEDLMESMEWNELSVIEILSQMASLLSDYPHLPSTAILKLLHIALVNPNGYAHLQLIIYEGLLFAKALGPDIAGITLATAILDLVANHATYEVDGNANVVACQTLLWNIGLYNESKERVIEAAHWYTLAAHDFFRKISGENTYRCIRKAALCHIRAMNWSAASELIAQCPTDEASTHYLAFLVAIGQENQPSAIEAVTTIVECSDFEAQQLVLITSLAQDKASHPVLAATMKALLNVLTGSKQVFEVQIEIVTVIRCLVKITVSDLSQTEDKDEVAERLVDYMQTAIDVLSENPARGQGQTKGIAWLYKCSYNVAVQGLSSLSSKSLADLFDRSAQLMSIYQVLEPSNLDPELPFMRASAMFACLCGKIFLCKELATGPEKALLLDQLVDYIPHCRDALSSIKLSYALSLTVAQMKQIINTSEIELFCEIQDWESIPDALMKIQDEESRAEVGLTCSTIEMCANILFRYQDCPSHIFYQLLELVLDNCSTSYASDIKRFSRWTRAILKMLLHRDSFENESTALKYVNRAFEVLQMPLGKKAYPLDEVHWLVATAWNRGLNGSSSNPQLNKWYQVALAISSCVPDLNIDRQKMHEHYRHLLEGQGIDCLYH